MVEDAGLHARQQRELSDYDAQRTVRDRLRAADLGRALIDIARTKGIRLGPAKLWDAIREAAAEDAWLWEAVVLRRDGLRIDCEDHGSLLIQEIPHAPPWHALTAELKAGGAELKETGMNEDVRAILSQWAKAEQPEPDDCALQPEGTEPRARDRAQRHDHEIEDPLKEEGEEEPAGRFAAAAAARARGDAMVLPELSGEPDTSGLEQEAERYTTRTPEETREQARNDAFTGQDDVLEEPADDEDSPPPKAPALLRMHPRRDT